MDVWESVDSGDFSACEAVRIALAVGFPFPQMRISLELTAGVFTGGMSARYRSIFRRSGCSSRNVIGSEYYYQSQTS